MGNMTEKIKEGIKDTAGAVKRGAEKVKDAAVRGVDKSKHAAVRTAEKVMEGCGKGGHYSAMRETEVEKE